ncbi:MAG: recombinase family protein [Desulfobacterales bacterium]|nr:recombinase family protein [Desulfobacterales bacterium]MBF0398072.1 recombinase family protein [Desulfobacterales bacterium]
MIIGYVRVSKINQEPEHQRNTILEFANRNRIIVDEFMRIEISSRKSKEQRKIDELLEKTTQNDTLIITELSRLGRSFSEVIAIVNELINKGVRLISIKETIDLKDHHSIQSKVMITMFSLFSELERDLISQRTKEALATKKMNGVKLGRPKGPGKSKLDTHKDKIQEFLDKDVSILSISKILGVSYPTLFNFIKQRRMLKASQRNN